MVTALAMLLALAPPPGEGTSAYITDRVGRTFRVGFDPGSRVELGGGYAPAWRGEQGEDAERSALTIGVRYRHLWSFPDEGIHWKLYHGAALGRFAFSGGGLREADVTVYSGVFMRWAEDGSIALPTNPPRRIPFPLNIGFDAELGRVWLRDGDPTLRVRALRSEILLDAWRRRRLRSYLQIGVGIAYDLWFDRSGQQDVQHLVAPFSRGSLTFHHESADGHHAVHVRAEGGAFWSSRDHWTSEAGASAGYEVILLAVNDMPISAYADLGYRYHESLPDPHEVTGELGLRVSLSLR